MELISARPSTVCTDPTSGKRGALTKSAVILRLCRQVRAQFDMGTFKVVTGRMSRDMTTNAPDAPSTPPQTVPTAAETVETATEPGAATVELRTTTRITDLLETLDTLETVEDAVLTPRGTGGKVSDQPSSTKRQSRGKRNINDRGGEEKE